MKNVQIMLRMTPSDYEALTEAATKAKTTRPEFIRTLMHESLAGFDPKHEAMMRRLKDVEEAIATVHELTAVVAALVSALDIERMSNQKTTDMTANMAQGFALSEAVVVIQQRGLVKKWER